VQSSATGSDFLEQSATGVPKVADAEARAPLNSADGPAILTLSTTDENLPVTCLKKVGMGRIRRAHAGPVEVRTRERSQRVG
jgi:hypothetical protein